MHDKPRPSTADIAARLGLEPRAPSRRPIWRWGVGGGLLLLLVILFTTGPKPPRYVTATAKETPLTVLVTATGTLQPTTQVDVGSEISGRIASVAVDFNDAVTAGQPLALLDTQELKARVIQSEATLASARATLTEARLKRDRIARLTKAGNASREELDTSQAVFDRADAAVTQAEAALEVDRTNIGRATIRSPIDGVVLDRRIEPGQTVAATFQTPVLFVIAQDLAQMQLHVDIDEADIGRVKSGQPAHFTVDAYPDRVFDAAVLTVRYAPRTSDNVVSYEALLDVANKDLALRPGMTATADIVAQRLDRALTVPNGALRFTPPGYAVERAGKDGEPLKLDAVRVKPKGERPPAPELPPAHAIVWLGDGRAPEPIVVKTGASDGLRTEIRNGALKPGDELLVDIERETGAQGK